MTINKKIFIVFSVLIAFLFIAETFFEEELYGESITVPPKEDEEIKVCVFNFDNESVIIHSVEGVYCSPLSGGEKNNPFCKQYVCEKNQGEYRAFRNRMLLEELPIKVTWSYASENTSKHPNCTEIPIIINQNDNNNHELHDGRFAILFYKQKPWAVWSIWLDEGEYRLKKRIDDHIKRNMESSPESKK